MNPLPSAKQYMDGALLSGKADVFTDLNSLQNIKNTEDKDEAIRKVAQQFESMFIHMMLKSMRDANAVFEEGSLFSSNETEFYRDMHDQQLSLSLAHSTNSIGIADAMYRQMTSQFANQLNTEVKSDVSAIKRGDFVAPQIPVTKPKRQESIGEKEFQAATAVLPVKSEIADSPAEFVKQIMPHLNRAAQQLGVPASFLAAQAALETGWGRAVLADDQGHSSFNIFNIKANSGWQGERVDAVTLEYEHGSLVQQKTAFRKYASLSEAVQDYTQFVQNNPRYQKALQNASDGAAYIRELSQAGYATDPQYAEKILNTHKRVATELATADVPKQGALWR